MNVILDLNEGRSVEVGCLTCKEDFTAYLGFAHPVRVYIVALSCPQCSEELVGWAI